ncbi:cell division topological specificity factor MinE [Endozoicomonas euniceicola]|uniref:Cell division topological specificity factor n=1 Tax=Endozoicomonas euniceicola TaxID=1234143 RepID=A0ABY6GRN9_9GAMM|nr:cell division topological specificity factor MinE [Endozoicomonas euniceicola]UYM15415.1 cell division topological specificity factor MinE [Endozoicomonas euniceicola]
MSLLQLFRSNKEDNSAVTAKERLQIIVAHERMSRSTKNVLPAMQKDILDVVRKYIEVSEEDISIKLDREGDYSVLEVNVQLPEA